MNRKQKLEQMLEKQPNDPFLHYGLAMELAKEGDVESAIKRFDRTLDLDPDYIAAYFHKANTLIGQNRTADAIQSLREGMEAARRTGDTHALSEMEGLLASLG